MVAGAMSAAMYISTKEKPHMTRAPTGPIHKPIAGHTENIKTAIDIVVAKKGLKL